MALWLSRPPTGQRIVSSNSARVYGYSSLFIAMQLVFEENYLKTYNYCLDGYAAFAVIEKKLEISFKKCVGGNKNVRGIYFLKPFITDIP
jgi:hypothetical protein